MINMAKKFSEEDREKKIILVGEHFKNTGDSTREIAKYFSENFFQISNCTVSDYCHRYMQMNPEEVDLLRNKINKNTVKDVNDEAVRNRVLAVAELFLSGLTVNEITERTSLDFWVIYRDLTRRLKLIDPELSSKVYEQLQSNSRSNLRNGK